MKNQTAAHAIQHLDGSLSLRVGGLDYVPFASQYMDSTSDMVWLVSDVHGCLGKPSVFSTGS